MRLTRKIAMTGVASMAVAVGTLALPFSQAAHATAVEDIKQPQKVLRLLKNGNKAVDVDTELNCSTHTLTAKVTNKTKSTLHPDVTFNNEEPTIPSTLPIEPGKTGNYYYNYSGNNMRVDTQVNVDTFEPVVVSPTLYCNELVSFNVTESSDSAVVGRLGNNSSLVPQTVYTQVGGGDVRVEQLQPGESRTIALPLRIMDGQIGTIVRIATSSGYESSYNVALDEMNVPKPPIPLPIVQ